MPGEFDSHFPAQLFEGGDRKSDYVEETAIDPVDKQRGKTLGAISTGLVTIFSGIEIPDDFSGRQAPEVNAGPAVC